MFPLQSAVGSFGSNSEGQLGIDGGAATIPVVVDIPGALVGKEVVALKGGLGHSLALTSDGQVFAWGYNSSGQLGDGTTTQRTTPVAVNMSGALAGKTVTAIAAGTSHSLALTSDGQVFAWGSNTFGELGDGTKTPCSTPVAVNTSGALAGKTVIAIAAGLQHSLALTSDGQVFAWGDNGSGQLGDGMKIQRTTPVAVSTSGALAGKEVLSIVASRYYSLALTADGQVFAWGSNGFGQLGDGTTTMRTIPVAVNTSGALAGKTVTAIAAGTSHSIARTSDGKVFAWGYNGFGQLGDGSTTTRTTPVAVDMSGALFGKTVLSIEAGASYNLAHTSDGQIFAWGDNSSGQLGDGTANTRTTPVVVNMTDALLGKAVTAITAGAYHSFALTSDGQAFAWGSNFYGQLGDRTTTQRNMPVGVYTGGLLTNKKVVANASGKNHSLALTSDGQVFAWGDNSRGQLGDGTTTQRTTPVAIDTSGALAGKTVIAIAAAEYHSLALTSDGQVFAWGYNSSGQLGNGSTSQQNTPVAVNTSGALAGKTVIAIAACSAHSLALTADGHVFAWGYNFYGQLGNGSKSQQNTPVAVNMSGALAGKTVIAITAGAQHSLALASDGQVFAWGDNFHGQLGDGTRTQHTAPVAVDMSGALSGKTVLSIAAGDLHSLALTSDGQVFAWGYNANGGLGDGTTTQRTWPVAVDMSGALSGKSVVAIAAGAYHGLALTSDWQVFAWGSNNFGQLGDGTTTQRTSPVAVDTSGALAGKKAIAIAAGISHSLLIISP